MNKNYLIMLPGWGMDSYIWSSFSDLLSDRFELIHIEWNDICSIDDYEKKVINIISKKNLSTFSILGWSLGSLVALNIAHMLPNKITHLILMGGTSCFTSNKKDDYNIGWQSRIVKRMQTQLVKEPKEVLHNFYQLMFSQSEIDYGYYQQFLDILNHHDSKYSVDSLNIGLEYLIQTDLRKILPSIHTPLLFIHGDEDKVCPVEGIHYVQKKVINSSLEILDHTGHLPFLTKPNICIELIEKFVRGNVYD